MSKLVEAFRQSGGALLFKGNLNESGEVKIDNQQALITQSTNFSQTASLQVGSNIVSIVAADNNNNETTNLYQVVVNPSEAETFQYDLNGNLISRSSANSAVNYDWDGENRLIRITQQNAVSTNVSEFSYDGLSRRVRIVEKQNNNVVKNNTFVWKGGSLAEERNSTGFITTKQYFGAGLRTGGQNYYYTWDHLGSVREMTDASGTVRARYDYDPFGRKTKLEGNLDSDFGYTGHYHHAASGLSLALYRAYDPDLGRFINRDPIKESGGFNLYGYTDNNPINYVDRDGLCGTMTMSAMALLFIVVAVYAVVTNPAVQKALDKAANDLANGVQGSYEAAKEALNAVFSESSGAGEPIDADGNVVPESDLTPTGEKTEKSSTNKKNPGGTVVEEGFRDKSGRDVSKQTIYDKNGNVSKDVKGANPHYRPGPPKP